MDEESGKPNEADLGKEARLRAVVELFSAENRSSLRLGTLCVLGNETREFDESDLPVLSELAAEAVNQIESRRPKA